MAAGAMVVKRGGHAGRGISHCGPWCPICDQFAQIRLTSSNPSISEGVAARLFLPLSLARLPVPPLPRRYKQYTGIAGEDSATVLCRSCCWIARLPRGIMRRQKQRFGVG